MLALAYLHSAGFTHKDLKKLFEIEENYEDIYELCASGKSISTPWITTERKAKILDNLKTLDV
ncbi:MAG: hypothetical protein WAW59_00730 [Patescibacteria group bacterium]